MQPKCSLRGGIGLLKVGGPDITDDQNKAVGLPKHIGSAHGIDVGSSALLLDALQLIIGELLITEDNVLRQQEMSKS